MRTVGKNNIVYRGESSWIVKLGLRNVQCFQLFQVFFHLFLYICSETVNDGLILRRITTCSGHNDAQLIGAHFLQLFADTFANRSSDGK